MNNFVGLRNSLDLVLTKHNKSVDHNKVVSYVKDLHSYVNLQEN
jgi:hypothetical protein